MMTREVTTRSWIGEFVDGLMSDVSPLQLMGGQTSEINLTFAVDILSRLFSPVIMKTLSVLAILGLEILPTPSIPVIPPRSPRPPPFPGTNGSRHCDPRRGERPPMPFIGFCCPRMRCHHTLHQMATVWPTARSKRLSNRGQPLRLPPDSRLGEIW